MASTPNFVTDIDGNRYPVARFGERLWMLANLRASRFANGDPVPLCPESEAYVSAGVVGTPASCFYDNVEANAKQFGMLYNWYAAHDERGIAPNGWRLPFESDWEELESVLALCEGDATDSGSYPRNLKALREQWTVGSLGGSRGINGAFGGLHSSGYFWSYLPNPSALCWGRKALATSDRLERIDSFQRFGFAIRCVKDL